MLNEFTKMAQNALNNSLLIARELGNSDISCGHILLGILKEKESAAAGIAEGRKITYESSMKMLADIYGKSEKSDITSSDISQCTKNVIENSSYKAMQYGKDKIGTVHLLLSVIEAKETFTEKILEINNVKNSELESDILTFLSSTQMIIQNGMIQNQNSKKKFSIAKEAPILSQYGSNLCECARNGTIDPVICRDSEIERLIQILIRRTKNNACLIGEPGVGKTAVAEGLAQRIVDGDVPGVLENKVIFSVDIPSMIAGTKYRGEFEERLKNVINEVRKNPDIILFIDEFHIITGAGAAEGAIDAANILKPALSRGEIQIIGATTTSEYKKKIEKDAALERRFQPVTINEPTVEQAIDILKGLKPRYEKHHIIKITDEAIEAAVNLSVRYINDRFLPDKAIDVIDESASNKRLFTFTQPPALKKIQDECAKIKKSKEEAIKSQNFELAFSLKEKELEINERYSREKIRWNAEKVNGKFELTYDDVAKTVTEISKIPVQKIQDEENNNLINLDRKLREKIIGQDEASQAVANAIRRSRVGLHDPNKPIGSFIFSGPTGVGKTELCKALSIELFGSEKAMIRFDMSEYMEKHSVSKMIGSPPGYIGFDEGGQLTERVRKQPYSLILFDEIEKADKSVFNLLLQILDDGILTDSQGRKTDFKNTIIVMTTNAGQSSNMVDFAVGFTQNGDMRISSSKANKLKDVFAPEFLNRIDDIIEFKPLERKSIEKICISLLCEIKERVDGFGINVVFDDSIKDDIIEHCMKQKYGARPLKREIQRLIENPLSLAMLEGKVKKNDTVSVGAEGIKIISEAVCT